MFLPSPLHKEDLLHLLEVQVVGVEVVPLAGATDVHPRVLRTCSEDQQAEEADGEATLQRAAVKDAAGVQQPVPMVIGQGASLLGLIQMVPVVPHNRLDLKHR